MAERTQYAPGTFSWVDLTTTDQEAAKRFYGELFGWELTDSPVGEGVVYTMASLGGHHVAAISRQPQQQRDAGVPPLWNSYVTVESADEALACAREFGAAVHAPAFDVFDSGRMGVIQDPQGAFVMVWEPKQHIGAGLVNAPGALSWNELATPDVDASATFYNRLFGWTTEAFDGMGTPYRTIQTATGATNGGIRAAAATEPTYWLVYFGTDDLESSLARVEDLGGSKLIDPMELPSGAIAVAQDPQGAVFALYAGHFDA
jgi:uncharacterized protein